MLNLDRAIRSPMDVFASPDEVLRESAFTRDQRILALRQWRHDLQELQVATDERMGATDAAGEQLAAVDGALAQLDAEPQEPAAPTRHGG